MYFKRVAFAILVVLPMLSLQYRPRWVLLQEKKNVYAQKEKILCGFFLDNFKGQLGAPVVLDIMALDGVSLNRKLLSFYARTGINWGMDQEYPVGRIYSMTGKVPDYYFVQTGMLVETDCLLRPYDAVTMKSVEVSHNEVYYLFRNRNRVFESLNRLNLDNMSKIRDVERVIKGSFPNLLSEFYSNVNRLASESALGR